MSCIMIGERAPIPGYVKLPPSTVGFGGPLVSFLESAHGLLPRMILGWG